MSLKDTIQGAREEAGNNIGSVRPSKRSEGSNDAEAASSTSGQQGFTRRSASKAKPSRRAAAGVRVVSSNGKNKSQANMSKEEKKAERKREREKDDLRYNVTQKLLEERPEYKKARKTWWIFLIVGLVLMAIAFINYTVVTNSNGTAPMWVAFLAMGCMIAAYGVLIVGLIYDWRTIRPMRKDVDKYVRSMSEKRLISAINKESKNKSKKKK